MNQFFCCLFFLNSLLSYSQVNSAKAILQKMYNAEDHLHNAKFTLISEERLKNGKFAVLESFVKLGEKPKQIYFKSVKPNPGTEIIWKKGWNEDKMKISPGGFPFITFSMNPNNSISRKDSHHPIMSLGFEYVTEMVKYYENYFGKKFYNYLSISDTVQWDNRSCIILVLDFTDYAFVKYTVKKNEKLSDIAKKLYLNDYSIMLSNSAIGDLDDVKEGQVIRIPNFYARKIEFYMDRATGLPLRQLIYDQNGLYEKYEMKSFLLNPVFKPEEFSPEYKEYGF